MGKQVVSKEKHLIKRNMEPKEMMKRKTEKKMVLLVASKQ